MKHLKILEYVLSSLWRRKCKNLAIMLVFAFTISILASVMFLTHALRTDVGQLLVEAPELILQRQSAGRHELIPLHYGETIRGLPGVIEVQPRMWGYYYDALTETNYTLLGVDSAVDQKLPLLSGRMPSDIDECAVGIGVAENRGISIDDELSLIDATNLGRIFTVTGIFQAEANLLTNDLVILTEDDLRGLFAFSDDRATDLAVRIDNPREIDTVAHKVKQALPDTRLITRSDIFRTYAAVFNWRSGMLLTVFMSAAVAFCILAWDKATGLSSEECRDIGILKAIGWEMSDILFLKFWEGMAIAVIAFLIGLLGALVHVFLFGAPLLSAVIKGWSTLFPVFELTPYIDYSQVSILAFLTIAPYVVSTIVPSLKAAMTEPDRIMRS